MENSGQLVALNLSIPFQSYIRSGFDKNDPMKNMVKGQFKASILSYSYQLVFFLVFNS